MDRLTERNDEGIAYLSNVKEDQQDIEGTYDTLKCLFESWQRLADLEDAIERIKAMRKNHIKGADSFVGSYEKGLKDALYELGVE